MNTVIFDLDGTLLPMDQELFIKTYFKEWAKTIAPFGYLPEDFQKDVWVGTKAMLDNNGSMTNEERFWESFVKIYGEEVREMEPEFHKFYLNEFSRAKVAIAPAPLSDKCIKILKKKGYTVALATNPLFPRVATLTRMGWAGLDPSDFEIITTYENSSFCKPKLEYYKNILIELGKEANECIMIGNDVREDMCVEDIGMDTYLLTDCLIDHGKDILKYRQGNFEDLYDFINKLPEL
ncbi:MAG: HAD family hydrolase [Clostridiales bacterium]|nr:HAD family hydrolase [Clostridiales bacterium]